MDENGVITEAFQSTPSVWRETLREKPRLKAGVYFNPLPPCGGRRCRIGQRIIHGEFQSTPSVWRETARRNDGGQRLLFQSTPSVWRETMIEGREWHGKSISIHSLRVEGDGRELHDALGVKISIHSLRVEGDRSSRSRRQTMERISIHSLRVEGDQVERADQLYRAPFQSTPSVWRETPHRHPAACIFGFQSTPSVWRETVRPHDKEG